MSNSYPPAKAKDGAFKILGLQLHPVDVNAIHSYIDEVVTSKGKALILNLNIHCCNLAVKHPWLMDFMNAAQLVFCDGDGVRWGVRLLGGKPPEKVTYDRWMWQLAEFMSQKGYTFYFLGGVPGVAAQAAEKMKEKFPNLKIQGIQHGYFEKRGQENEKIIEEINRVKPDVLVVGFGMPVQEKWLEENWRKLDCHIFLSGGAVFDYVSGRAKRAPQWMIRANMEWLFRFLQEPGRLFTRYVFGNPIFFFHILCEKFKKGRTQ